MRELKLFKKKDKTGKITDPWFIETVENGLKATNVKVMSDRLRINRKVPIKYFEYNRIFGIGAFTSPLKVEEILKELKDETPNTKGFVFGNHKYYFLNNGLLRIEIGTEYESFYSEDTLRNQSVACYFKLVYSNEEERLISLIQELENATTSRPDTDNRTRKRIQNQGS